MIAAFADLQIGVMLGRELDAEGRHEVQKRVMRLGHMQVYGVHHLLRRMGTGNGQHFRVNLAHQVVAGNSRLGAEAAGDDHATIGSQGLADGVKALPHGVIDEAAGVDNHQIGAFKGLGGLVAFRAQLGQDQL